MFPMFYGYGDSHANQKVNRIFTQESISMKSLISEWICNKTEVQKQEIQSGEDCTNL